MCWANKLLSAERPSFPNSIGLWLLVHGSPSKSVRVRKAMSLLQARIALVSNGGIAIVDFVPPGLKSWLEADITKGPCCCWLPPNPPVPAILHSHEMGLSVVMSFCFVYLKFGI